jgi:hypothetical protein
LGAGLSITVIPDVSQFQVYAGRTEIPHLDKWPAGLTVLVPHIFPLTWEVEDRAGGYIDIIQEGMKPMLSVSDAWQLLHHDHPKLFEEATFNYRGNLKSQDKSLKLKFYQRRLK